MSKNIIPRRQPSITAGEEGLSLEMSIIDETYDIFDIQKGLETEYPDFDGNPQFREFFYAELLIQKPGGDLLSRRTDDSNDDIDLIDPEDSISSRKPYIRYIVKRGDFSESGDYKIQVILYFYSDAIDGLLTPGIPGARISSEIMILTVLPGSILSIVP